MPKAKSAEHHILPETEILLEIMAEVMSLNVDDLKAQYKAKVRSYKRDKNRIQAKD